jgi:type VI secretion system secreted protein Hcp
MAVVAYYLKIDGIDGESQDDKHKNEIDLDTFSWGETNSGDAAYRGGEGAGKVSAQDFHFVMKVNKASPKLMEACASGEGIKKAVLTATKAGKTPQDYLKVTLHDFIVSSYQTLGGHNGDVLPTDHVTLNFSKMEMEYKEQQPTGSLGGTTRGGWDFKTNKKA